MADFIKGQISSSSTSAVRPAPTLHAPQLGFGLNGAKNITLDVNTTTKPTPSSHDPAKLRAISILKRSKEHSGSNVKTTKRRNVSEDQAETGAKRSKLGALDNKVDLDALMKRKSIHDSEANKAQGIMVQQHLDGLEAREKVETFVTECMSVKDVKVVSCKKCGYTAPRQSELCMREGHAVKRSTAEKRFFKCGSCKKRTVVYSMMPTKPCQHCEANEWIRVAMKDEPLGNSGINRTFHVNRGTSSFSSHRFCGTGAAALTMRNSLKWLDVMYPVERVDQSPPLRDVPNAARDSLRALLLLTLFALTFASAMAPGNRATR
ncbi:hypothetical protein Q1695_008474 [Nippostrongylus brasiliensis]|nr:hypothetical protein Q1695_008474 [Nippostrongylus brasiliensis]